ncbi:MAG: hypothetical protein QXJ68_01590 [Methanocellales archaeon]
MVKSEAQVFTLEGLGAAVIIMLALYFMLQSPVIFTPPTAQHLNVQLSQLGRDALLALDIEVPSNSTLANYTLKSYLKAINKSDLKIPTQMRKDLCSLLPRNVMFNVVLSYVNLSGVNISEGNYTMLNITTLILNSDNTTEFITNLTPPQDSTTASHLVVLYDSELSEDSPFKVNATEMGTEPERIPHVIEVRLELWYV